jgi:hypothetical protein
MVVTVAALAMAGPANASFAVDKFATSGDAFAGWNNIPDAPPGSTDQQSILLLVNTTSQQDFGDSALAAFKGFAAGGLPATPPSFDFKVSTTGPSGGSARLRVRFSDGGSADLRSLALVAGAWIHEDGSSNWDTYGGACGFRYQQPYSAIAPCHPGAVVTAVEIANDSGWLHPGGLQILIDDVAYAGETVTKPEEAAFGQRVNVTQLNGDVVLKVPNPGAPPTEAHLRGSAPLAVGSFVDSRRGRAKLNGASAGGGQSANFRGGIFQVGQSNKRKAKGLITLTLGGSLAGCDPANAAAEGNASSRRSKRRRLWARGRGRFRTRGRNGAASVRGTSWFVEDRCRGTFFKTLSGKVEVFDAGLGKTVALTAGKSYLARSR